MAQGFPHGTITEVETEGLDMVIAIHGRLPIIIKDMVDMRIRDTFLLVLHLEITTTILIINQIFLAGA